MTLWRPGTFTRLAFLSLILGAAYAVDRDATSAAPHLQETPATNSPVPTQGPTPTPSPADRRLAASFAKEGKLDEAIGAHLAVLEDGKPDERLQSRTDLAQLYLDEGDPAGAIKQLDAYLLEAPPNVDVAPNQFLMGEALSLDNRWQESIPLYDAYIAGGAASVPYARMGRAEALARMGRTVEANDEAERALQASLPVTQQVSFVLTMAQALEASDAAAATGWYQRLAAESEAPADDALALWRAAKLSNNVGDQRAAWETIIKSYPETAIAQEIVDQQPPVSGLPGVTPYDIAVVHYFGGRDADAGDAFSDLVRFDLGLTPDQLATAAYYLAVIDERAGDAQGALDAYTRVVEIDADSDRADDALWWRGRLEEHSGDTNEARRAYETLASDHAGTDFGQEARFRLALLDYDDGRFEDAESKLDDIAKDSRDVERQRVLLWKGKALSASGDDEGATKVWQELRNAVPDEYYGLRAAVLLGEADGGLKKSNLGREHEPDWQAIDAWLRRAASRPASAARELVQRNEHWRRGFELMSLGMQQRADAEFGMVLEAAGKDPMVLYEIAHRLHDAGQPHLSSRAATRLLDALPNEVTAGAPADLWRLAYPAAYRDALDDALDNKDVSDLLMLALVRQESFFDAQAGSTAGALGLAQVVPKTGEAIALQLDVPDFQPDDLFRPVVNLAFGAHYLEQQLDSFDGNIYRALAAYNAGPDAARRWGGKSTDDADRFYAEIEFSQTRAYVQLVSENLARYRQLYQGLDAPELPGD